MKLWLTGCLSGRFLLTFLRPKITRVRGGEQVDAYETPGEPMARGTTICEQGTRELFGAVPPPLTPTRVEITGRILT